MLGSLRLWGCSCKIGLPYVTVVTLGLGSKTCVPRFGKILAAVILLNCASLGLVRQYFTRRQLVRNSISCLPHPMPGGQRAQDGR